jgi:hypothetical protein
MLVRQSVHRIDQQIEAIESMTLEQLKDRVAVSIQVNPDDWRDDEAIAGESDPPREEQELVGDLEASVLAAASVPQIVNARLNTKRGDAFPMTDSAIWLELRLSESWA